MNKKALAYVSDIILGRTGEIISRDEQKKAITQYAADNGIEIVAWFEDEQFNEDVLTRPGIQKLLGCDQRCDCLLVERVWALSRNTKTLQGLFAELNSRQMKLEAATTLWDCVSQMSRHYFAKGRGLKPVVLPEERVERVEGAPAQVRKPAHMHFLTLARKRT
jgi:DNA invertase Pin-like site-specific DNA recombinase